MIKKGKTKHLQELSRAISKIKAILAADDGTSKEFTTELQTLEKEYLDRLHQALETQQGKHRIRKEVTNGR